MQNKRAKQKSALALDESGATAIVFALALSLLCGFAALALDIGHMAMVKAELQRTADAAALAGVTGLLPYTNPGTNQTPNWLQGQAKAQTMISSEANKADNMTFTDADGTIDYGYWLLNPPIDYVQTLPKARPTTAAYLPEPAITVMLSRNVNLYFAPVVGVSSPKTVSATAIAILPEAYSTSGLPPVAVSSDTVYNTTGQTMVIDVSEQDIKIQSNKGIAGWFNLNGGNDVGSVKDSILTSGTGAGTTPIYLVPGTKATLTDFIQQYQTIAMPVVQDVSQKVWRNIDGFAAFKVDKVDANSMEGHFVNQYFDPNVVPTAGTGTIGGVAGTPKLVGP
jgi:Flp pilus assembly protein TadG